MEARGLRERLLEVVYSPWWLADGGLDSSACSGFLGVGLWCGLMVSRCHCFEL